MSKGLSPHPEPEVQRWLRVADGPAGTPSIKKHGKTKGGPDASGDIRSGAVGGKRLPTAVAGGVVGAGGRYRRVRLVSVKCDGTFVFLHVNNGPEVRRENFALSKS